MYNYGVYRLIFHVEKDPLYLPRNHNTAEAIGL